jgi:VWFA-related protein
MRSYQGRPFVSRLRTASLRVLPLCLLVLGLFTLDRSRIVGAQDEPQVFRTGAVGVVVDAVVHGSGGRSLKCLSRSDFSVSEDGKPQQIEGFEIVGSSACENERPRSREHDPFASEVTTAPPVTAVVFEELGPGARAAAFRAAQIFVRERRLETEFVGVFTLDFAIHAIVPYTRDETALLDAVRRAAMRPGCPQTVTGTIANADGGNICDGGGLGEVKVKATLSGLQAVVKTLALLPGRKNVLLFSEGFRVSTADSADDRLERLIAEANQRGVTFHAIDALGLRTIDGRQAVRQRMSSYTGGQYQPGGLAVRGEDANALLALDPTAALARLADGTGGEFVENTNDLDGAIRHLADEMHDYYRLSYRPTDQSSNRRYRQITVKVSVPGATVRTRSGYYLNSGRDRDAPVLQPSSVAPHLILDSGAAPRDFEMITSLPGTGRDVEVRASVPASALTFRTTEGRFEAAVTILARAIGRDKSVLASASDSFVLSGPTEGLPAARARTIQFSKTLVARNAVTIEIIAHDALGGHTSVERHDVSRTRPR